jgi:hypothetical protein
VSDISMQFSENVRKRGNCLIRQLCGMEQVSWDPDCDKPQGCCFVHIAKDLTMQPFSVFLGQIYMNN